MTFAAITHCDINGLIGMEQGSLAYKSKEDFLFFKDYTLGNATILVMGKNTYKESGNLPGRIILSLSSKGNLLNGEHTKHTVESLAKNNYMILCGGPSVYKKYLLLCEEVIINFTKQKIKTPKNGIYFPLSTLYKYFYQVAQTEYNSFSSTKWAASRHLGS